MDEQRIREIARQEILLRELRHGDPIIRIVDKPEPKIGGLTIPQWEQIVLLDDVLVEVWDSDNCNRQRYLKAIQKDPCCFIAWKHGMSSETTTEAIPWYKCQIIESTRWRPNPGHQPVPGCVIVEVERFSGGKQTTTAKREVWSIGNDIERYGDIKAFRIIGTADE